MLCTLANTAGIYECMLRGKPQQIWRAWLYTYTQFSFGHGFRLDNMKYGPQAFILEVAEIFQLKFSRNIYWEGDSKFWGKHISPNYLNFTKISSVEIKVIWYQYVTLILDISINVKCVCANQRGMSHPLGIQIFQNIKWKYHCQLILIYW